MFYVKKDLDHGCSIKIDITDENVFTACPGCGTEHKVDLAEMLKDGEADLFGTQVYCPECFEGRA